MSRFIGALCVGVAFICMFVGSLNDNVAMMLWGLYLAVLGIGISLIDK